MTSKIREYIENAFVGMPDTKKMQELKEELFANLIDKYNDSLISGKSEVDSYTYAIASIGDIDELIESMRISSPLLPLPYEDRKRSAIFVAAAVGMYILSPFILIVFAELFNQEIVGLGLMFTAIAVATGLLIYNGMTRPKYTKTDDTLVEEFKEWRGNSSRKLNAYKSFKAGYWGLVVVVYLLTNFIFGIWSFSWIIFIIAGALENIIKGYINLKGDNLK